MDVLAAKSYFEYMYLQILADRCEDRSDWFTKHKDCKLRRRPADRLAAVDKTYIKPVWVIRVIFMVRSVEF